jgi:hypothetical protein
MSEYYGRLFNEIKQVILKKNYFPRWSRWPAGSKAWVCGRSCCSIARGLDGCQSVVCCQVQVSASGWSLVQRSPTEFGVSECGQPRQWRGPDPLGALEPWKKNSVISPWCAKSDSRQIQINTVVSLLRRWGSMLWVYTENGSSLFVRNIGIHQND